MQRSFGLPAYGYVDMLGNVRSLRSRRGPFGIAQGRLRPPLRDLRGAVQQLLIHRSRAEADHRMGAWP